MQCLISPVTWSSCFRKISQMFSVAPSCCYFWLTWCRPCLSLQASFNSTAVWSWWGLYGGSVLISWLCMKNLTFPGGQDPEDGSRFSCVCAVAPKGDKFEHMFPEKELGISHQSQGQPNKLLLIRIGSCCFQWERMYLWEEHWARHVQSCCLSSLTIFVWMWSVLLNVWTKLPLLE